MFFSPAYLPAFQPTASTCLDGLTLSAVFHVIQGNRDGWDADLWRKIKWRETHACPLLRSLIGFWWWCANRTSCWSGWSRPPAPTARPHQAYSEWYPRWHSLPGTGFASADPFQQWQKQHSVRVMKPSSGIHLSYLQYQAPVTLLGWQWCSPVIWMHGEGLRIILRENLGYKVTIGKISVNNKKQNNKQLLKSINQ